MIPYHFMRLDIHWFNYLNLKKTNDEMNCDCILNENLKAGWMKYEENNNEILKNECSHWIGSEIVHFISVIADVNETILAH